MRPTGSFTHHRGRLPAIAAQLGLFVLAALFGATEADATAAAINISQVPLTVTIPAHPQVVVAIGNSESMDGSLSGAIMAGSGSLGANYALLQNSSSPVNFAATPGFTPPVTGGVGTSGPYTSVVNGSRVDNSPSRLNVAKGAVTTMLKTFMANTDFALMDYSTSNVNRYTTWVYEMSPTTSGFVFTNVQAAGSRYVLNPCQNYKSLVSTNTVYQSCKQIDTSGKVTGDVSGSQWMQISASSDDPLINDVLYAGGIASVCMVYGGPNPSNPWPPNYSLSQYNSNPGNIVERYSSNINSCATATTPTNAGFVPYTPQTMYIERGFGYGGSQRAAPPNGSYWSPLVDMTSAGQNPTSATVNTAIAKFTPFLAPETDNTGTTEIKASAGQSALAGLLANAKSYYQYKNPVASIAGCSTQRYVILLTDGLPTLDLSGKSWPPPGTVAADSYGMTVAFNADGSLNTGTTNDQALIDTINSLASLSAAGVKTYVIGLGAGVDPTQNPVAANVLTAMAIAGGTSNYFAAKDPVALTASLNVILAKIQQATQSTSSSAVNSSGIHFGSVAYQAQFTTSDSNQDWTGNFLAFPIDPSTGAVNTDPASAVWSAQTLLDGQSWDTGRLIATWDPAAGTGIPFRWTSGTPSAGIASSTTLGTDLSSNPADKNGQDALNYLRGDRNLEASNGGPYRTRTHVLGDIVDSAPLYVGPPTSLNHTASYAAFAAQYKGRPPVVYVGANDGMLHAFDAATGAERFAFIPNGVFANLIQLTYPLYNTQHQFFVDGSPQAWDVQFGDNTWHTVLVSGESAGGKSVFALDVTDPATITSEATLASRVLWEFTDGNMGYSYGEPSLVSTAAGSLVLFGNGYDSPTETPFLYALDPQTGVVKAKIDLCSQVAGACDLTKPNGLSAVTAANSSGVLSGTANILYAGDLQGNVWRIDMSNANPSLWTASVLFQAKDASNNPQPITTKLSVSLNPQFPRLMGLMVYVGTGQMLAVSDLGSTQTQTLYGIYDAMPNAGIVTRANLIQQTLSNTTVMTSGGTTVNARTITSNAVPLPASKGWYVDFSLVSGERVVTDPVLDSGVLDVTTNQPSASACEAVENSWFNQFNYATGGAFPISMFDVTESGEISPTQPAVSGVYLGNVFASSVRVRTGSFGNGTANRDVLINESGVSSASNAYTGANAVACPPGSRCDPILNALGHGGGHARTAWWEIR